MDSTARMIQIAVARADLLVCAILAWPWQRILASFAISIIICWVVRAYEFERHNL